AARPGRPFLRVLYDLPVGAGISVYDRPGPSGRRPGVPSNSRLDRFGRGYADHRVPDARTLDLDGRIGDCVEVSASLCVLASHHGRHPGTATAYRAICADGGRSSGWRRGPVPLDTNGRCAANRMDRVFLDSELTRALR